MEEIKMEEMSKRHPDYENVSEAIIETKKQLRAKDCWTKEEINKLVQAACEWSWVPQHFEYVKERVIVGIEVVR